MAKNQILNITVNKMSKLGNMGFQFFQEQDFEEGMVTLPAFTGIRINYIKSGKSVATGILKTGDIMIAGYTDFPLYGEVYDFSMKSIGIHFTLLYLLTGILPRQCRIPYKITASSHTYTELIPFFLLEQEKWESYSNSLLLKNRKELNPSLTKQVERVSFITELFHSNPILNIKHIAGNLKFSYRQVQRDFHSILGMTPTEYERLARFQFAAKNLKKNSYIKTAIAVGYYDQAHMIKEFKKYSDKTPSQLFAYEDITNPFIL